MKAILQPRFAKKTTFGDTIKKEINNYFETSNLKKTGDWVIWHKAIVLFVSLGLIYYVLVFGHAPPVVGITLCALMGLITAAIGFNVMHDANHKSYSSNKTINYMMGLSLNVVGGNAMLWKEKHNNLHHPFTNIPGHDEDIEAPLLRFHPAQSWKPIHQYQYLYWPVMYGLIYFAWIFINDFKKYFRQRIESRRFSISTKEHIVFWLSKVWYGYVFIYIPIQYVGLKPFVIGYTIMSVACGIFIAIVFQLAHIVEEVEQPTQDEAETEEGVYHQIATTANFATESKFFGWLCGGLNYQVEHHIVPHVSHVHYPALSKIVKQTCKRFGVPYHEYKTFGQAVRSHIVLLKKLGKKPIVVQL
jgi:linoleoyl-CoA desaturase